MYIYNLLLLNNDCNINNMIHSLIKKIKALNADLDFNYKIKENNGTIKFIVFQEEIKNIIETYIKDYKNLNNTLILTYLDEEIVIKSPVILLEKEYKSMEEIEQLLNNNECKIKGNVSIFINFWEMYFNNCFDFLNKELKDFLNNLALEDKEKLKKVKVSFYKENYMFFRNKITLNFLNKVFEIEELLVDGKVIKVENYLQILFIDYFEKQCGVSILGNYSKPLLEKRCFYSKSNQFSKNKKINVLNCIFLDLNIRINDFNLFKQTILTNNIGNKKSYGFGFMEIEEN